MNSAVGDIWRMYMNKSLAGFNGLFTIEWDTRHITVMDRWVVVRAGLTYRLSKLQFYYICFKIFLFLDNLITSVNSESIPQAHTQAFSGEVTWFCWSSARPCTTQQGQQLKNHLRLPIFINFFFGNKYKLRTSLSNNKPLWFNRESKVL